MDKEALIQAIRDAGVVGQGGAGFPAHVKYDVGVETVIANGCECEPLLHTDQHVMRTEAREIVRALREVVTATGAARGVVGIKRKYAAVAEAFTQAFAEPGPGSGVPLELFQMDNFYPAGDEQILVHEVTGRTIPPLGLPKDVGALVANVGTLYAVSRAMDGEPVTHKLLTVTGEVARPAILRVPIGTTIAECVAHCGGATVEDPVFLLGGPMMGRFADTPEAMASTLVTKTSGGVIVLERGHHLHRSATLPVREMQRRAAVACIQCRACTDLCPRHLIGHGFETHKVMRAFGGGTDAAMGALQAWMCCECGVCELFSCPMSLSPRRINALLKQEFRRAGAQYSGPREVLPAQADLRPFRKIPVPRLAHRLDIDRYMDIHPEFQGDYAPGSVRIPLQQHIGAPAVATVKAGDAVKAGARIGAIPEGKLGAAVHASISGTVAEVDDCITIKGD
ncbi:MAG: SLBB domain-containing protein [Desulfovibrionaceae bacterium]|jgi:Na+-translocating ferredoxin:NAD+ oxidoreductase RnfC subunit|nr:SLBB domain-containing protein [Desulfovibrionaceae bacterium]